MAVDEVRVIERDHNSWLEVTLHEGKHHEVKRLLEAVGHQVSKLKRVAVGPLTLRGLKPGEFVHTFGDTHLYLNHLEQADLQLSRRPLVLPKLELNPDVRSIFDFKYDDFRLTGYDPHPHIKAPVAV